VSFMCVPACVLGEDAQSRKNQSHKITKNEKSKSCQSSKLSLNLKQEETQSQSGSWVQAAHTFNPSYLGDLDSRPAQANSS
jgi:hypothetical protein